MSPMSNSTAFRATAAPPDLASVGAARAVPALPADLRPHPDKAISQRATLLAAVADGTSHLDDLAECRDVWANLRALAALGVNVRTYSSAAATISGSAPAELRGDGLALDAGNSATTSRLLIALLAGSGVRATVTGNALLRARPMGAVTRPLRELGADLTDLGEPDRLPVRVHGTQLHGGVVTVPVDSAQPVSALLFAGAFADAPVRIRRRVAARDHTERLLRWTGVPVAETPRELTVTPGRPRAFDLRVPGDPSGAALLAALHLASPHAQTPLELRGVGLNPRRTGFLRILAAMGAEVEQLPRADLGPEPVGDVRVRRAGPLAGVAVEGAELLQSAIDEIPLIAALAATAHGRTVVRDAAELRDKDTDRIDTTVRLLRAFGVHAEGTADGLVVFPTRLVAPPRLELPADHRVVFAAFVLALLAGGGVELHGVAAAATSHPGALTDLARYAEVTAR